MRLSDRRVLTASALLVVLCASAAFAGNGCFLTPMSGASHAGYCNLAGTYNQYWPAQESSCVYTPAYWAGCCDWRVGLQRKQSGWSNQDCTGTLVSQTAWIVIGTAMQSSGYSC